MSRRRAMRELANEQKSKSRKISPDIPQLITQVERIFMKFGGPKPIYEAFKALGIEINLSTIYRWSHSRSNGGCNGIIPTKQIANIMKAATHHGILLSSTDLDPRPFKIKYDKSKLIPTLEHNAYLMARHRKLERKKAREAAKLNAQPKPKTRDGD